MDFYRVSTLIGVASGLLTIMGVCIGLSQRLRQRSLRHVHDGLPLSGVPARPSGGDLPAPLTIFIGRDTELRQVKGWLRDPGVRLLALTGISGIGKTRLAWQTAEELRTDFPAGVWSVSLASISDPALVAQKLTEVFWLVPTGDQPLELQVEAYLRDKRLLLLLDNFEHVVPAGRLVTHLLQHCRGLKVLVTSIVPLGVAGEHVYQVPPMALPDPASRSIKQLAKNEAIRLFVERAQEASRDQGFTLTKDNADAVAGVCQRLDGVPLAIELAAARIRWYTSPHALLQHLSHRLELEGGGPDQPERFLTVRGAVAWSHDLLAAAEQSLFRRLAVFAGGFTDTAAARVAAGAGTLDIDVARGILSLEDKTFLSRRKGASANLPAVDWNRRRDQHLAHGLAKLVRVRLGAQEHQVSVETAPNSGAEPPRFAMLETLREFGLERLGDGPEAVATRRAHALFFLDLAEAANTELAGPEQALWLGRLEDEHDNLRAALSWVMVHEPAIALRLAGALWRFWYIRGYYAEGANWLNQVLTLPIDAPAHRAKALLGAAELAWAQGESSLRRAGDLFEQAEELYRQLDDSAGLARVLRGLGAVARAESKLDAAQQWYQESLGIHRELNNRSGIIDSLVSLGLVAYGKGDLDSAYAFQDEALQLASQDPVDTRSIAVALNNLAYIDYDYNRVKKAGERYFESLTLLNELKDRRGIAECMAGISIFTYTLMPERKLQAVRLFGSVDDILRSLQSNLPIEIRQKYEGTINEARSTIPPADFNAAYDDGCSLSLQEAVRLALRQVERFRDATGRRLAARDAH